MEFELPMILQQSCDSVCNTKWKLAEPLTSFSSSFFLLSSWISFLRSARWCARTSIASERQRWRVEHKICYRCTTVSGMNMCMFLFCTSLHILNISLKVKVNMTFTGDICAYILTWHRVNQFSWQKSYSTCLQEDIYLLCVYIHIWLCICPAVMFNLLGKGNSQTDLWWLDGSMSGVWQFSSQVCTTCQVLQ